MKKIGFDNNKYLEIQSQHIRQRIAQFDNKLYLEMGGKLFDDYHASRVLPGFLPDSKIKMLMQLADQVEIVIDINASDIEKSKMRGDIGITYDADVLRLIDAFRGNGLYVGSVVIAHYSGQTTAEAFRKRLESLGVRVFIHYPIEGYPSNIPLIVSDDGFGRNEYVETSRPLVVVTAPGPGSGNMATCLSQLYHEYKRGVKAGYAKFETFPVWDLPLKHPVNVAYEAATADLGDVNMIDPYHLEAYGVTAVNYNRDIECFPIVRSILAKITGDENLYRSPTDMGVNMAGSAITDDEAVRYAANQEIIRRYYKAACDYKQGLCDAAVPQRIMLLINESKLSLEDRKVVKPALEKAAATGESAVAIQLEDGRFITGRTTSLMTACSACVLNSVKALAGIDDKMLLLLPIVLEPIKSLKKDVFKADKDKLNLYDVLTALSICAATNPMAQTALEMLPRLRGLEAHGSCMLNDTDMGVMRKMGMNITCEPEFASKDLYIK